MPDDSALTATFKEQALARLRQYREWVERRDFLVCEAKRAGATYLEIMTASALAKGTVNTILAKAGLTGPQTSEDTVPATTSGASSRYFPHHPHFLSATEDGGGRTRYQFRPFTGDEPEPVWPAAPKQSEEDEAMWAEYSERCREIDAAWKLLRGARYHKQVTPLVDAACKARPPVDEALREMDAAWSGLDSAQVWQVAVKRLLDAYDSARAAMQCWVHTFAEPLAVVESNQSEYVLEYVADWRSIARQLGHEEPQWDIGSYYKGDKHVRASYDPAPLDDLERTITKQRTKLEEIAKLSRQHNG